MFYLYPFENKKSETYLGGKGYNLYRLYKSFPVPNTLVISSKVFDEFILQNNLERQILLLNKMNKENYKKIKEISEKIRKLFLKASFFPLNIEEIKEKIKDWGNISVRSSSNYEDLATASFAGQYESYLNVRLEELEITIRKVWASLYTPRAIVYREIKNISHSKVKMAVVIQKMINSKKSGVIFTKNPVTDNENDMVIEAVFGLGEGIVSGKITPDNYLVDKRSGTLIEETIAEKNISVECGKSGGIIKKKIKSNERVLNNNELKELWRLGIKIEKMFGKPQDIEWAIDHNGKIWILQSRTIPF